jgi:hypothetical protein
MIEPFLTRLVRLAPEALVRMRPSPPAAWAMLPFRVLASLRLADPPEQDVTYRAADVLATGGGSRRDAEWRWPLPSDEGREVETIPVAEVVGLAEAAAHTLRIASTQGVFGRAVGERALRDALLDHVAVVVTTADGERVEIPQRLVQGLVRMGLHGPVSGVMADTARDGQVTVRLAMGWIGLSSRYGSAWYRPISPLRIG